MWATTIFKYRPVYTTEDNKYKQLHSNKKINVCDLSNFW